MQWLHDVTVILGSVGVAIAAVWGAFKLYLGNWLENRFHREIEQYKAAQQQALVHLQSQINTMFDRTVKLHQQEFEVVPEAFAKLNDAYVVSRNVALGASISPDLDAMTAEKLEIYIADSFLEGWQKDELRKSPQKTRYYTKAGAVHDLKVAWDKGWEFRDFLTKKGIWIPDNLRDQFKAFDKLLFEALIERRQAQEYPELGNKFDKGVYFTEHSPQMIETLERDIKTRLWVSTMAS